ncbi:MAG: hypothetical protein LC778_04500 [Acidobacteria bacterium]|nr:hypothetical protein [Acidobacteriota bacterium]
MRKGKVEKFGLKAIADAVRGSDVHSARIALSFAFGAALDIAGKVQKVVKRDGQLKLVLEPNDVPGLVVFADCVSEAENLRKPKIRKSSAVRVKGKLQSFGVFE